MDEVLSGAAAGYQQSIDEALGLMPSQKAG
jgi:hypothetical protein